MAASEELKDNTAHRISAREASILMLLAVGVGLASGFSAIILNISVHSAITFLLPHQGNWWLIPIPAVGAALSAIYLLGWLKDTAGHGVPEMIRATTFGRGELRPDLVFSRLLSSFLTVGSGGSAGLEGPIATSGGAIGSNIAHLFKFNERRRTLLLGYGVAGGVAAIFNAPLTGTVFALEVILGEWSTLAVLPTIVSAVSATQLSRLVLGNRIAFSHQVEFFGTFDLLACVLLGVGTGLLSVGFQRLLRLSERVFGRLTRIPWLQAGLGGLLVGGIGYFMPAVLHDGYLAIQNFLQLDAGYNLAWVALFILLKLAACSITLGSGGSGGVFAPSLVLGSAAGYGFGTGLRWLFPALTLATAPAYSLVGMAGMVAGLMHAPLTGMFLVLEITSGYKLILPLMILSVMSMLISYFFEGGSVYTRELITRGELARRGSDQHLLQRMDATELVDAEDIVLHEDMVLGDFVEIFKHARRNIFPVVERQTGRWLGVVYLDDIRPYLFDTSMYSLMTMGSVLHSDLPSINARESASSAIEKFETSGAWSLPVIDSDGSFVGMMSKSTLFDRYRRELIVHTQETV